METYVVLTRLKAGGAETLRQNPGRIAEINADAKRLGAKILSQYATLGAYDFVTVIGAPDNYSAKRIAADISAGAVTLDIYPALGLDAFTAAIKKQPYRTEPHRWQTSLWARSVRKAGRHWTTTRYVSRYCRPLTVEGRENLDGFSGPAIVIANHSSHFDSPIVYSALPSRIADRLAMAAAADKFYASRKKRTWWYSLFQNAFPVHRGGGAKQLEYPLDMMKRGWSVLIYPEGTRSRTGEIGHFKAGPAIMAKAAKVPVIPIYMSGLREIMPKGQREPRPGPARARIGKPVSLAGVDSIQDANLMLENAMRELAGQPPRFVHVPRRPEMAPAPVSSG